jgi:hypothetical protein
MAITPREDPNQSKTSCIVFTWDWSHRLAFLPIILQISDDQTSTEARQVGGKRWDSSLRTHGIMDLQWEVPDGHAVHVQNVVIHSGTRRRSWAPGSTIRRVVHNDNLEHPAHEQEAWCTTTIGFEFPRCLKNSTTTFQVAVKQPAMTDPIDGLTRPTIGTSSMTTRSSGLALTEIWIMKPEE